MADYAAEKTHAPTPRRRQQAREAGQFAKSQDLVSAAVLVAGLAALIWLGHSAAIALRNMLQTQLTAAAVQSIDHDTLMATWRQMLGLLVPALLPLLGIVLVIAVLGNVLQVGFVWLPQRLAPDWNRISPLTGWQRIFSFSAAVRLALSLVKIALVGGVALWSLNGERDTILALATLETPQIASYLVSVVLRTSLEIGAMLLLLALVDYGYQWWRHEQTLRMTADELREELRNLQGDPQVAARRRNLQRQGSLKRSAETVSKLEAVHPLATASDRVSVL